ncbi:tyrosine-type recombinase/integrase [Candidatus Gromoviella agglomerans]|uniref:tyrosine-type recombinase/integrase n=1 Tax=Candidatus Gromoviella agglomerans TaxID=2806609 RepID=UPI001E2FB408|nr:tyrosine-type recombinase/integrase [Candidatus Gromoviella agglomerans]
MSAEKFSSINTIDAYKRDVKLLCRYISETEINSVSIVENVNCSYESDSKDVFVVDRHRCVNSLSFKAKSQTNKICVYPQCAEIALKNCNPENLTNFISWLYDTPKSANSIARTLSCVRRFFKFLLNEKIIDHNPTVNLDSPRVKRHIPIVVNENLMIQLIDFSYKDNSKYGLKVSLILEIMYATGIRVSELIKIKLSNFSIIENDLLLTVCGKGKKERIIPLTNQAMRCLDEYIRVYGLHSNDWLFGSDRSQSKYMTRQRIGQILNEIVRKSSLNIKISPHGIRHSFATHMLDNGSNILEVKDLLGHSDVGTTQIYTHVMSKSMRSVIEKYHPLQKYQLDD